MCLEVERLCACLQGDPICAEREWIVSGPIYRTSYLRPYLDLGSMSSSKVTRPPAAVSAQITLSLK